MELTIYQCYNYGADCSEYDNRVMVYFNRTWTMTSIRRISLTVLWRLMITPVSGSSSCKVKLCTDRLVKEHKLICVDGTDYRK